MIDVSENRPGAHFTNTPKRTRTQLVGGSALSATRTSSAASQTWRARITRLLRTNVTLADLSPAWATQSTHSILGLYLPPRHFPTLRQQLLRLFPPLLDLRDRFETLFGGQWNWHSPEIDEWQRDIIDG
jgi:hypothetical protein